jgi:tetratricopeptide (TPR) repeat protein
LFAAIILPHAAYIALIGGDHFEYRPLDLYFPFLFILLGDGARRLAKSTTANVATLAYVGIILVGLVALPLKSHRQFPDSYQPGFPGAMWDPVASADFLRPESDPFYRTPGLNETGEAYIRLLHKTTGRFVGVRQEEHRLFLKSVVADALRLRRLVEEGRLPQDTHLAIQCVGAVSYYSDLRILDCLGLTDARVAHSEFVEGSRVMAHGKMATADYIRQAGVDIAARDEANFFLHVTSPDWLDYIWASRKQGDPTFVSDAGDGYYLLCYLPKGPKQAARELPRLQWLPLSNRDVSNRILTEAVDAHRRTLKEDPHALTARTALANTLYFRGEYIQAAEQYEEILSKNPNDLSALHKLATLHLQLGHPERAVAAAERALELAEDVASRLPYPAEQVHVIINSIRGLLENAGAPAARPQDQPTPRP